MTDISQVMQGGQAGVSCYSPSKGMVRRAGVHPRDRIIPGTGQVKDEICGHVRAVAVCSADPSHDQREIHHSCNRLECPICYKRTLQRNSAAVASRVQGYRQALAGQRTLEGLQAPRLRAARHGILSPPQSVVNAVYDRTRKALAKLPDPTSQDLQAIYLEKFRYETYKRLELLGIDGAAVIIHFDRVSDQGKALHRAEDDPGSRWAWLRGREDWRSLIYFSPHVHILFYGQAEDTKKFYEASGGWVFKNKGTAAEPEGLAYYLLSHAPVIHDRLSVTYWGCLSPRKLKAVEQYIEKEEVLCEKCGSVLVYASLDAEGNIQHLTDRPLYHKRKIRNYALAGPPPCDRIVQPIEDQ